jgi:hypothetical protein
MEEIDHASWEERNKKIIKIDREIFEAILRLQNKKKRFISTVMEKF